MTIILTIFLGFTLIFTSCEKIDVPKGTPSCIKKKIRKSICLDKVYEYDYDGEKVYVFETSADCIDAGRGGLYSANCEVLCNSPILGGWIGKDTSYCYNFETNRTNKKLIWSR